MKIMTVISSIFSCWPPWFTKTMSSFFKFADIWYVFASVGDFSCCFFDLSKSFLSSLSFFISLSYFSSFAVLVVDLFRVWITRCFHFLFVGLSERNLSCIILLGFCGSKFVCLSRYIVLNFKNLGAS